MKKHRLSTLAMALVSCAYLTQCTTIQPTQQVNQPNEAGTNKYNYPKAREHQAYFDPFLYGEFGMSANTADINQARYDRVTPDDGIDRYSAGVDVDKYRWLEDYDPINPHSAKETTEDRQRNFIGSPLEDDRPLAQETTQYLQTVAPKQSSEVNDWVNAQNKLAENYIEALPFYKQLKQNAQTLKYTEQLISKVRRDKVGQIHIYRHADGYRRIERIGDDGTRTELVNERKLSQDGKSVMRGGKVSPDGTYVAFFVRQGSADSDPWFLHVVDTQKGELATPIIGRINRTNQAITWLDDDTFFYTAVENYRSLVFRRDINKKRFNDPIEVPLGHVDGASINSIAFDGEDSRYIIMDTWDSGDSVYIKDRKTDEVYRLHNKAYFDKVFRYNSSFNNNILAKLVHFDPKTRDVWIMSGENDRKGQIIKTNLDNLKKREVAVPMPEGFDLLRDAYYHEEGDGYFLISYLKDGVSRVVLTSAKTGNIIKELTPDYGNGFASHLTGNVVGQEHTDSNYEPDDDDAESGENYVKFRYQNPTTPATDYKYSIKKDAWIDVRRFDLSPFDEKAYETKLVFYTAKDGTKIPMNISYKKGTQLNGKNPTLLYGYGGYGVIYDQTFGFPANSIWLENGGVWAHAFIRGGGEYGDSWQRAAQHTNRLVGYDDFAAAADYLSQAGYASSDYLGIIGGSNGGLLVGAAMVRHPEKYRVAFPQVAVFDQFRHDKAGVTQYWLEEYGSPEEGKRVYDVLKSYSPYHNLNKGTCYPSTLIQTSKRDDRVVPSHSYKFTAALQEAQGCDRPAFLHAAEDQGHSPNTFDERHEDELMTVAFALSEMGVNQVPVIGQRPTSDEMKTEKWRLEEEKARQKRAEAHQKRLEQSTTKP